jgi:hypothetical protein
MRSCRRSEQRDAAGDCFDRVGSVCNRYAVTGVLRDAERLRDIIHDIDSVQRLDGRLRSHADVREEVASYLVAHRPPACALRQGTAVGLPPVGFSASTHAIRLMSRW